MGKVLVEAGEGPETETIYADIGMSTLSIRLRWMLMIDTDMLAETRRNLPVTIQRRFDVYPDVSA